MFIRDIFYELILIVFIFHADLGLSILEDSDYYEPSFNRCPSIHNELKNGRVRYISKGRIAKFLCDRRFELVGKTSSTCLRGQWNNPVPVCVARGCSRVRSLTNGRVTAMYRGAILVFVCNPGYALNGSPTIHCDGRRWNATPPLCVGNSSTIQISNETTSKDYTSSKSFVYQSIFYSTLPNFEETFKSTKDFQTEKISPTNDPLLFSSSSLTSNSASLKMNTFAEITIPVETQSSRKITFSNDKKSFTTLKTEILTSSTSIKTTDDIFIDSPISTKRMVPATISLELSNTQSASIRFQSTVPTTKQTNIFVAQRSQVTNTTISTLSKTIETTMQYVPVITSVSNTIRTDGKGSFAMDSSSAVTSSNTDPINLPGIKLTSITKAYNLRPRKRSSTMSYSTTPVNKITSKTLETSTQSLPAPVFVSNHVITDSNVSSFAINSSSAVVAANTEPISWPRILLTSITKAYKLRPRKRSSTMSYTTIPGLSTTKGSFIKHIKENISKIYTPIGISRTADDDSVQTTEFYSRFIKSTEKKLQKNSELNGKMTSSRSMVKGIISIIIVIALVLIIVSLACYIRKQRSKRQSKLSDDSDMRFFIKK